VIVLVEHLLEETPKQRAAAGSRFADRLATASRFNHRGAAVDRSNAASRLANRSRITAVIVLVEQLLKETAELGAGAAAGVNHFAAANRFGNFATANRLDDFATASGLTSRIATTITQTIKQAEASFRRAAGEHECSQQGGGDNTTHR
jgi:hypothetical protein